MGQDWESSGLEVSGYEVGALVEELVEGSDGEIGVDDLIAALDDSAYEIGARPAGFAGLAAPRGRGAGGGGAMAGGLAGLVAKAKAKREAKNEIKRNIQNKFASKAVALKPSVPIDAYGAVMNFRSGVIAPGAAVEVFETAIETFKPDEVSLPVEIGPDFLILRVDVGMRKLYASNGPMRASLLNSTAFSKRMFNGITVQRGQPVTWLVQNTAAVDRVFESTLFGQVVLMGAGTLSTK